jgi:dolichol-phosphate mannosyltransferase
MQTSLRELAEVARRVFSIEEEPAWAAFPARDWDTDVWVADARRAADELGWQARTSLEAGLAAFAHWMDAQEPAVAGRYRATVGAA